MVGDIQTGAGVTDWLGTLKTGMKENQIILEVIKKLTSADPSKNGMHFSNYR